MIRSFERRIATGFGGALLLRIPIGVVTSRRATQLNPAATAASESQEVLTLAMALLSIVTDVEARDHGFALTGDAQFLESPAPAGTLLQAGNIFNDPRRVEQILLNAP